MSAVNGGGMDAAPERKNGITERERKMDVSVTIIGTEQALNTWTKMFARINGKTYEIQMVRFDEPSIYGIRKGRISKLWARGGDGTVVINYDRGWDIRPATAEGKALLAEITKRYN